MLEVTGINLLAVLMAWWGCRTRIKRPMLLPCLLLACFFSIRYKYGNDYNSYTYIFNMVNAHGNIDHFKAMRKVEIGWKILCRIFKPVGFQGLVVVTTFFQLGVFGWFVTKYVPRKWQWVILVFYILDPWYMLYQLSAMRQTVALSIMLMSVPYILKRKLVKSFLFWIVAFSFHQSVFIALPLLFAGFLRTRMWKWTASINIALAALAILGPLTLMALVQGFTASQTFDKYAVYMSIDKGTALSSGFGFLFRIVVFAYMFILLRKAGRKMYIFGTIYQYSYVFKFLGLVGAYFGRLGFYFAYMGLPAMLLFVINWKKSLVDRIIFTVFLATQVMGYFQFFYNPVFTRYYLEYRTIFTM